MIPPFREDGWLPEGHHRAEWEELIEKFGGHSNSPRQSLLSLLLKWRDDVRSHHINGLLIVNGSFASRKITPRDIDAIFIYTESSEVVLKDDHDARQLLDYDVVKNLGIGDLLVFPRSTAA